MAQKASTKFVVIQAKQIIFLDFSFHFKGDFHTLDTLDAKHNKNNGGKKIVTSKKDA